MSRLDDIKARLEAATPGPWRDEGAYSDPRIEPNVVGLGDDGGCSDPECCGGASYHIELTTANGALIAHAPEDIRWLLEQLAASQEGGPTP